MVDEMFASMTIDCRKHIIQDDVGVPRIDRSRQSNSGLLTA